MARIMRNCEMHQKNFAISIYGSWENAEAEGANWIAELRKSLPPCRMNERDRMTKSNRSGIVGVYLARKIVTKPNGREYEYWLWMAKWQERRIGIGWYIGANLDDDDAFALAALTREMQTVDRTAVRAELAHIYGSKRHIAIMERKRLYL